MQKIIAAFDGLKYSAATRDYAINFASSTGAHLVGVFLEDPSYTSYKIYELIGKKGNVEEKLRKLDEKDAANRMNAVKNFEKKCLEKKISFSIHHDHRRAIKELKEESLYADLLIIDARETLMHYSEKLPTTFIRDLLGDVHCPVLLVPARYKPFTKVIMLFDGEPSSVHAIKMFSYLHRDVQPLPGEVIYAKPVQTRLQFPDKRLMQEFIKRHYPSAKFITIRGWAEEEIVQYLKKTQENALVVLGAYRRGKVSRWFRESMADILMKEVDLPLFIAHNK